MEGSPLFSVGHGMRPVEEFVALLRRASIRRLVDVRKVPASRRNPQYGKEALARVLEATGMEYVWRGIDLGGFRTSRPDSRHIALRNDLFRGYADHMDTRRSGKASMSSLGAPRRPQRCSCAPSRTGTAATVG